MRCGVKMCSGRAFSVLLVATSAFALLAGGTLYLLPSYIDDIKWLLRLPQSTVELAGLVLDVSELVFAPVAGTLQVSTRWHPSRPRG